MDKTKAILEERAKTHGEFTSHALTSQALKEIMRERGAWTILSPHQKEALEMIQHKIARILNGDPHHEDHWADIAGYARLVQDRLGSQQPKPSDDGLFD